MTFRASSSGGMGENRPEGPTGAESWPSGVSGIREQIANLLTDAMWEGFERADNCCTDRRLDVIDTGGNYESFNMQQVADHVASVLVEQLGLTQEAAPSMPHWTRFVTPYIQSPPEPETEKPCERCGCVETCMCGEP